MAGVACPNCGKPCLLGAPVCRWCKSKIPAPVHAAAEVRRSPELEAELGEIREWTGNIESKPVPPISLRTWIALAFMTVGLSLGALVSRKLDEVRVPAMLIGGVSVIAFFVFITGDLKVLGHRHRLEAGHAAHFFFQKMKSKQWSLARTALADYPTARARHEALAAEWKQKLGSSIEVTGVFVTNVEMIKEDAAVASVHVNLRSASAVGCLFMGILGAILFAKRDVLALEKLVLLRNGRWYLVCGLPNDRIDRRLIRDLRGDYPATEQQ